MKDKIKEGVKKALKEYTPALEKLRDYDKGDTLEECGCDCHRRKPTSEDNDGAVHDSLCCDKMNGSLLNWGLQKLLKKEKEKSKLEAIDIPMGVSAWMNHGKKYGYDKFWKDKIVEEILDMAIGEEKEVAKYLNDTFREGYARKKEEIIKLKNQIINK